MGARVPWRFVCVPSWKKLTKNLTKNVKNKLKKVFNVVIPGLLPKCAARLSKPRWRDATDVRRVSTKIWKNFYRITNRIGHTLTSLEPYYALFYEHFLRYELYKLPAPLPQTSGVYTAHVQGYWFPASVLKIKKFWGSENTRDSKNCECCIIYG